MRNLVRGRKKPEKRKIIFGKTGCKRRIGKERKGGAVGKCGMGALSASESLIERKKKAKSLRNQKGTGKENQSQESVKQGRQTSWNQMTLRKKGTYRRERSRALLVTREKSLTTGGKKVKRRSQGKSRKEIEGLVGERNELS